jgi:uncharacterized membrane protein HdeD (DUF308 family)
MILITFLSGIVTALFLIASLFFLRFWRKMRDGLFLAFALAFLLLGVGQALLTLAVVPDEERSWLYLVRLAAFALILAAIIRKNRRPA